VLLYSVIPEVMPLGASPSARPARDLVVGMVGRITPWKGQDVFLSAFARAFPDGAQRAVIVGSPMFGREEEQYAEGLRAQAHELGIADRVDFRGFREDVAAELAAMDVLVHASVTAEPFGQVILEGMAAGLPVVATAGGGPSEIVDHDLTGLLYPPGDSAELGRLLGLLDADQDLRARLGAAGFERARDFGPGEVSAKLMAVYAAALDGRNGRRRGSRRR
jgi:glycosyltransferase involved in cell wall biosynthesis